MQLGKYYKSLRSKGSITVEACVVLPVFLCVFFLLLFMVRFTCTGMALDHAVNETAKEIAAAAYPITFANELEDESIGQYGNSGIPTLKEELERLGQPGWETRAGNIPDIIALQDFKEEDFSKALEGILENYGKGITGGAAERIAPSYWRMKSAVKYAIADTLVREHLDVPLVSRQGVKLRLVEFPQSKAEYEAKTRTDAYRGFGLTPGRDFDSDDVVIQLEYGYRINFPFMKSFELKLIHTAVERAWIKGSFGIITADDEGLELEPQGSIVFITRTGIRYHVGSCRYLRKSRIPIDIKEAAGKGYTPCKVCKPDTRIQ